MRLGKKEQEKHKKNKENENDYVLVVTMIFDIPSGIIRAEHVLHLEQNKLPKFLSLSQRE